MLRLRQVAFVAEDLGAAESKLGSILDEDVCFRDPSVAVFGLENGLFAVGDQFLEIVSPTKAGTTAGRLLDKRRGDGGYMVILQTDDLAGFRERLAAEAVRVVYEANAEGVTGLHLHPKDVGGAILSVDQTDEPSAWPWAGDSWRSRSEPGYLSRISAVEIQGSDPDALANRWSKVLARPVSNRTIRLDDGDIRFVPDTDGRGDGVSAVELVPEDSLHAGPVFDAVGVTIRLL